VRSRTLLAGGRGDFLSSHLCVRLLADGHEVVCLNNFGSGRPTNHVHRTGQDSFELLNDYVRNPPDLLAVD
jgi:nucleoside-diphosphate-sugar epimerase